jgi:hypothetical protein
MLFNLLKISISISLGSGGIVRGVVDWSKQVVIFKKGLFRVYQNRKRQL